MTEFSCGETLTNRCGMNSCVTHKTKDKNPDYEGVHRTEKRYIIMKRRFAGFLIAVIFIVLCFANAEGNDAVVVLDTDVGTDDAIAMLLASHFSDDTFDYVIASQGNTSLDGAVLNALLLKKYLGLNTTVVKGIPPKSDANVDVAEKNTFHGLDGLANLREKLIERLTFNDSEMENYISFDSLVEELSRHEEIIYIATGPTTNLANLIEHEAIRSKISKVYIMGGGISEYNCSNKNEFNFSKDPRSVDRILSSGLDITLFPLDLTNHQRVDREEIDRLEKTHRFSEFVEFLKFNLRSNILYNGIAAAVLHDTMPVLYCIQSEAFRVEDMRIKTDQYGATEISDGGTLIHVANGVDGSLLRSKLLEIFE